jgi:hypothetical protein
LSIYNVDDPKNSTITKDRMDEFIRKINRYKPEVIDGYVSSFVYIADYITKNQIQLYRPQAIVTGAEYLSPEARQKIEQAFGCKVYNRYGGTEIGLMAHECGAGNMHIMADKAYAEIVADGRPVAPGELGKIVFTDFTDRILPFIRYEVGDMGIAADPEQRCPCGRGLPMLQSIEGRINDLMPLKDGSVMVTHLWFKLFREFQFIRQFQVVQEDYDLFRMFAVLEPGQADADLSELKAQVQQFVPGATVHWHVVPEIVPGKGGKLRHTISEVPFAFNENRDTPLREAAIERVRVDQLKPHEEVDESYVTQLAEQITADRLLKKPLVVDAEHLVILDGHHRYHVALALGLEKVPVVKVNYFDEQIQLEPFRDDALTKEMVIERGRAGQRFAYKTTRHLYGVHRLPIVQCLPEANAPIDELKRTSDGGQ